MNLEQRINEIIEELVPYNPQKVILVGRAAGQAEGFDFKGELSMVIIKETREAFFDRIIAARAMIPRRLWPVDFKVYTLREFNEISKQDSSLNQELSKGRVIYEK